MVSVSGKSPFETDCTRGSRGGQRRPANFITDVLPARGGRGGVWGGRTRGHGDDRYRLTHPPLCVASSRSGGRTANAGRVGASRQLRPDGFLTRTEVESSVITDAGRDAWVAVEFTLVPFVASRVAQATNPKHAARRTQTRSGRRLEDSGRVPDRRVTHTY